MTDREFKELSKRLSAEEWATLLANPLPQLPSESIQIGTAGKAGLQTMREASDFFNLVRTQYRSDLSEAKVVDFGCGWGRIARTFLKEVPAENIMGVDPRAESIALARQLAPILRFEVIGNAPPLPVDTGSVNIIVGYSVFSHLPENLALIWIDEFARALAPTGLVAVTTRPRAHIEQAAKSSEQQNLSAIGRLYAAMFKDFDQALAEYDRGDFVYAPTGGGKGLDGSVYGEAIIPAEYVKRRWTLHFEFVEFVERWSAFGYQPIIVLRRR